MEGNWTGDDLPFRTEAFMAMTPLQKKGHIINVVNTM